MLRFTGFPSLLAWRGGGGVGPPRHRTGRAQDRDPGRRLGEVVRVESDLAGHPGGSQPMSRKSDHLFWWTRSNLILTQSLLETLNVGLHLEHAKLGVVVASP